MTDLADLAATIEAEHIARGLARIDASIPAGTPGECDECGEQMPRLVGGRCGFCRDGRRPPLAQYDAPQPPPIPSPAEEHVTMTQPTRKIDFTGTALHAIEQRAADCGISFKQAAAELIELARPDQAAFGEAEIPSIDDLSTCDLDELFDEIRNRINAAASKRDLEAALIAAIARAEHAEARLEAIRAQVLGA